MDVPRTSIGTNTTALTLSSTPVIVVVVVVVGDNDDNPSGKSPARTAYVLCMVRSKSVLRIRSSEGWNNGNSEYNLSSRPIVNIRPL